MFLMFRSVAISGAKESCAVPHFSCLKTRGCGDLKHALDPGASFDVFVCSTVDTLRRTLFDAAGTTPRRVSSPLGAMRPGNFFRRAVRLADLGGIHP